jgi:hypothetical protein
MLTTLLVHASNLARSIISSESYPLTPDEAFMASTFDSLQPIL